MRYAAALALLMLADAVSTIGLTQLGLASELNPLMARLMLHSHLRFVLCKIILGFAGGLAISDNRRAVLLTCVVYCGLMLWHITAWLAT